MGEHWPGQAALFGFFRLVWILFCVLSGGIRRRKMAHSQEDIQNNNVMVERSAVTTTVSATSPTTTSDGGGITLDSSQSSWVLAQLVARGLDTLADDSAPSSLTCGDEYLEDPLEELTLENLRLPEDYLDPSMGYEFVGGRQWGDDGRLDNCQALVRQLEALGVRVRDDYLTLDMDLSNSRSASVSSVSDEGSVEENLCHSVSSRLSQMPQRVASPHPPAPPVVDQPWRAEDGSTDEMENEVFLDIMEEEVAEAEILPCGGVKVTYENYSKEYRPKISSHHNYLRFLQTVHSAGGAAGGGIDEAPPGPIRPPLAASASPACARPLEERYKRVIEALQRSLRRKEGKIKGLPAKIRRLLAEEVTYDAVTPDSGVQDTFNQLSPEEQEKQREEWQAELTKTEEEIQTLRQVLGSKVRTAQDLKRRLGITVWREFTDDFNQSMKTVRESQTVQKANEVITDFQVAVSNAPLYQKTAGAMSAVGEKTSSLFGGIGAKFGQLKETPTFKSFEERVGGVYSAARQGRMGGSGSNSTQDFEEALKEAEGEKAALEAANGGGPVQQTTTTTPGQDVTQPAAS